jgi:two-component system LytT family sensor kinase
MKNRGKIWNWRTIGAVLCFYTILSLFFVPRVFFGASVRAELTMLLLFALGNYIWAILTLAVFYLGEKFPVTYPLNVKNLALHFLFSLGLAAVFTPAYVALVNFYNYGVVSLIVNALPASFIINTVTNSFMYYTGSLAAHQAIFYSQKFRERESQLQEAELQLLKMQLHPHFFFNTLNAISALMYRAPKEADRLIVQLGDMFRIALRKNKTQKVPLKEELEFLRAFLHIHQTLMGKRLQTKWEIEPETLDALVPNLILQPLAENAIQHGIAALEEGGNLTISAVRENENLFLRISDDGCGLSFPSENHKENGIGLANTRARLENLYPGAHGFSVAEPPGGGTRVEIKIPFREQRTDEK